MQYNLINNVHCFGGQFIDVITLQNGFDSRVARVDYVKEGVEERVCTMQKSQASNENRSPACRIPYNYNRQEISASKVVQSKKSKRKASVRRIVARTLINTRIFQQR